jgi:hypothetical protein
MRTADVIIISLLVAILAHFVNLGSLIWNGFVCVIAFGLLAVIFYTVKYLISEAPKATNRFIAYISNPKNLKVLIIKT